MNAVSRGPKNKKFDGNTAMRAFLHKNVFMQIARLSTYVHLADGSKFIRAKIHI